MFVGLQLCTLRVLLASGFLAASASEVVLAGTVQDEAQQRAQIVENYGRLPLRFEANQGQLDKSVRFVSRGNGYGLYLTNGEAVLALQKPMSARGESTAQANVKIDVLRMQLAGGQVDVPPVGIDSLPGVTNYMMGENPELWHTSVPSYSRVRYAGVYPGVDLVYYGNQQQLEYDFVVAARTDPSVIRMHFDGAKRLTLDHEGNLVITAEDGNIAFHKPVVYQAESGRRRRVAGRFMLLADNSIGFALGSYDHSKSLIIDPTLVYSTYLGGSNSDSISAISLDSTGAAYLTGTTSSTDYPVTPGVIQTSFSSVFVTKLNASGTALVYSTFLGGSSGQTGLSIGVDASGDAYLAGNTSSSNFPVTTGAFQTTNKAAAKGGATGFVSKINPTGTKLVYSTYLGGSFSDGVNSLVVDSTNDVYVAGFTYSSDFPTTAGVFQTTNKSASDYGWNEFVAKLNPAGNGLLYATCVGGSGDYGSPSGIRVAIDSSGDAFVTATVLSHDFPVTAGVYQSTNKATGRGNMTLSKVNPTGTKLLYATYLGGASSPYGDDEANGLAVDSAGDALVAGITHETDYPVTTSAYETTNKTGGNGKATGFITKVNPAGTALVYSTYLGGSAQVLGDYIYALALDSTGNAYLTGSTGSTDFPVTTSAYQTTNKASNNGSVAFLTELNPTGNALVYSTYMGGTRSFADAGYGVALGSAGAVYLAGLTGASDFPITSGAYKTSFSSQNGSTGFVAKFTLGSAPTTLATITNLAANSNPTVAGTKTSFTAYVAPATGTAVPAGNVIFNIDQQNVSSIALNSKGFATYVVPVALALGKHAVLASYAGNATYAASGSRLTENIVPAKPVITPVSGIYPAAQLVAISDATAGTTLYYTVDGSVPTASSTKYTSPIVVSTAETVQAMAVIASAPNSVVAEASYGLITAPSALAVAPTTLGTTTATVNGLVNAYGMAGTYLFEYGISGTALTSRTSVTALTSSPLGSRLVFVPVQVSANISGLKTKTTYYYHVVVITPAGTSSGEVLSFTTN